MTSRRRALIAWAASAVVLFVVGAAVLAGVVDPAPGYSSLSDDPDDSIPGTVAYTVSDGGACLRSVAASGAEPLELQCDDDVSYSLGWTSDGQILVIRRVDGGRAFIALDPYSGNETRVVPLSDLSRAERRKATATLRPRPWNWAERADGAKVRVRHGYEGPPSVVVRRPGGEKKTILKAQGAGGRYGFRDAQWSPDGKWVLVSDSAERLLVVDSEGASPARVLVDETQHLLDAAWYIPGEKTNTVKLPR